MGLVAKAFQDIITFSRASSGTYVNSNGYITNSAVLNYLTYSNQPENAAWTKSNSFVQQNLLTYSQEFDNAAWTKPSLTITANATIAPDGTLTADKIAENTAVAATHELWESISASATTYTASNYFKAAERTEVALYFATLGSTAGAKAVADLSAGTVAVTNFGATTGSTATITNVGNGWYRVTLTVLATAATYYHDTMTSLAGSQNYAGTVGFGLYVWGAQLVQGSVPGDYRATTSAALPVLYADYNGALRARKLCEDATAGVAHRIFEGPTTTTTSSFSVIAKAGERSWMYLRFIDASSAIKQGYFNLATGTLGTIESGMTGTIVSAGNGYYRCTFTGPALAGVNTTLIGVTNADATAAYTGDGSSGIYIADAQLNDGSSALAYYDTTASAYNAPRFDYDPVTLAAKGLLVEESRTNYMTRASDFSSSVWQNAAPNFPTVTADAILSPDGTTNADLLTAATGGVACQARQIASTGTTGNFTASVFLKVGSATRNRIVLFDGTTVFTVIGDFQVTWTAGVASIFSTTSGTASIVSAGNGWYRCIVTASTATANASMGIAIYPDPVAGTGTVYAWQAQVEAGAFATSAIPTVASQVTRAADVASVNTLSPWYNSVAGTFYAEWNGIGSFYAFATADATNSGNESLYAYSPSNYTVQAYKAAVLQANIASSVAQGTLVKSGIAFAANDFAVSYNGAAAVTDATYSQPTMDKLRLGSAANAPVGAGWLRRITYYPRRLTNAELQTLTTL